MHLEIAVVRIGLAREQALELAPRRLGAQSFQSGLGVGDDGGFALGLAQLDQFEGFGNFALDPLIAGDRLVELGALAQQLLRGGRIVP